jgi:hypothetical protein
MREETIVALESATIDSNSKVIFSPKVMISPARNT